MQKIEENCTVAFGQIAISRLNLEMQEEEVKNALVENAKKRQELLNEIEEELGPGSIDMQTLEFTPKEA